MKERYKFPEDKDSIKAWYDEWSSYVASVDFESARNLFASDVTGFGTFKDFVEVLTRWKPASGDRYGPQLASFGFAQNISKSRCPPIGARLPLSSPGNR